jgi:DNA-binding LytR/AlgR family response regulator
MESINVLILEDKAVESAELTKILTENGYKIAAVVDSISEAVTIMSKQKVDLVIIDVFLGGAPDGIKFAESLNTDPVKAKPFIYLTSSNDRVIYERAKHTHPFGFLIKPLNELEVLYTLDQVVEKYYSNNDIFQASDHEIVVNNDYLYIKKKDSLKKVMISEIIYIEVDERYCNIITEQERFLVMISLTKLRELLSPNKFIRTHRNYIVNIENITEIFLGDNLIKLKCNHEVALSDKYKEFIQRFLVLR